MIRYTGPIPDRDRASRQPGTTSADCYNDLETAVLP
jgi:hypothetical protein